MDAFGYELDPRRSLVRRGFDVSSVGTVGPALTAALAADDWATAVRTAVCLGGDTDTLACIAGGVAEAAFGLPEEVRERVLGFLTDDLVDVVTKFHHRVRDPGGPEVCTARD